MKSLLAKKYYCEQLPDTSPDNELWMKSKVNCYHASQLPM